MGREGCKAILISSSSLRRSPAWMRVNNSCRKTVMKSRTLLLATASMAFMMCDAAVMAQNRAAPAGAVAAPRATGVAAASRRNRHLLFIATPGGGGADDQSGIVVLDADHDYRFVKRISYGLPAARMPGPEVTGIAASVPENKIYVTRAGGDMLAFDLATDKIVWSFRGEKTARREEESGRRSL